MGVKTARHFVYLLFQVLVISCISPVLLQMFGPYLKLEDAREDKGLMFATT